MESKRNATNVACTDIKNREMIRRALAEDAACRRPGVLDGLYGLDTLVPFTRLGHGIPVIRHNPDNGPIAFSNRATGDADFATRLHEAAPYLATFDLQGNGLILAGGAASSLLMRSRSERLGVNNSYHDYDLFLVGHASDAEALAAIAALGDHLHARWGECMYVYRTQQCITFHYQHFARNDIVQVILRRYNTIGEVIHGFDLGSSSVAWDGHRVFLTGLGKLAAEHGVNVLNLVARRGSYERRLARYFERGYDLVLPDLNVLAFDGRLPYLYADGLAVGCNCHLKARALYATRPGWDNSGSFRTPDAESDAKATDEKADASATDEKAADASAADEKAADAKAADASDDDAIETSDYAFIGQVRYGKFRAINFNNFRALGRGAPPASLCAYAKYVPGLEVRTIEPDFNTPLLVQLVTRSFGHNNGGIVLNKLKVLLGFEVAAEVVLESLTSGKPPSKDRIKLLCDDRIDKLMARPHEIPFAFMGVEDGTALTGPFPRMVVSPADWYGAAFRPGT
jgi:hypothetical protein